MPFGETDVSGFLGAPGVPTDFAAWRRLAADRCAWRLVWVGGGGSAGQAPTTNDRHLDGAQEFPR